MGGIGGSEVVAGHDANIVLLAIFQIALPEPLAEEFVLLVEFEIARGNK